MKVFRSLVVILGASNVRRSLVPLTRSILELVPRPADIVYACGHGRSYCQPNFVLGWSLPSLKEAKWREHCRLSQADQKFTIITDVGNDLFYDFDASEIAYSVRHCVGEFASWGSGVMVGLPLSRIEKLHPIWFGLMRRTFFPGSRLSLYQAIEQARRLQDDLQETSRSLGFSWVEPSLNWYGWDPIHIRYRDMNRAWPSVLHAMLKKETGAQLASNAQHEVELGALTKRDAFRLRSGKSHQQFWFRWDRSSDQPWMTLNDGTRISFY